MDPSNSNQALPHGHTAISWPCEPVGLLRSRSLFISEPWEEVVKTQLGNVAQSDVYKTGKRVPFRGHYVDQYGVVTRHEAHRTFPPCIGRKSECAFRTFVKP
jgi:hypothetical protein